MIEPARESSAARPVRLSFVHGAALEDSGGLLRGSGKAKRYVEIASVEAAGSVGVRRLVRAAAAYRPESEKTE